MNKSIFIVGTLIVVLLAGGFFFYTYNKSNSKATQDIRTEESVMEKFSGSITDLLSSGKSLQCEFSSEIENVKSSGKVYIQGENMSGEFTTDVDGTQVTSNMIRNGEWIYTWATDQTTGIKMQVTKEDLTDGRPISPDDVTDPTPDNSNENPFDDNYTYDCSPWIPNSAMFTPPTNIEFVDLQAQMQEIKEDAMGEFGGSLCEVCDSLPSEDAITQCKTQAGC